MLELRTSMVALAAACLAGVSLALPIVPRDDAEVIEVLPAATGNRAEARRLQRERAARPLDAGLAVVAARDLLARAHAEGDPRYAGQALAALQAWPDPQAAPPEVLLMQATVQQFLHEFDSAARKLELLTQRAPQMAQAWLTLATVRRVQGRYDASDRACAALLPLGVAVHAAACRAENDGLRGRAEPARTALRQAAGVPGLDGPTRNWLLTTLAELEVRQGQAAAADAAYQAALDAAADDYSTMSYADFLIDQGRAVEALARLKGQRRTDAVLLRLAIAGVRSGAPQAGADAAELRERIALANQRPGAQDVHAREQAMFALWIDRDPARALALARSNVAQQREPLDLRLFAEAARAAGQGDALREAARLVEQTGLRDTRIAALL